MANYSHARDTGRSRVPTAQTAGLVETRSLHGQWSAERPARGLLLLYWLRRAVEPLLRLRARSSLKRRVEDSAARKRADASSLPVPRRQSFAGRDDLVPKSRLEGVWEPARE